MSLKYVNGKEMKVNVRNICDEYFTKPEIARHCFNQAKRVIKKFDSINKYVWVEPSAGECNFFDLMPKSKRIGIDINSIRKDIIKDDYLKFKTPNKPFVVLGNPPFGHRGVLALEFINHSKDADYVCFILPMFFMSVGKGSVRYRVKGFNLIHEEVLPDDAFYVKGGSKTVVKCCFQIWSKNHSINKTEYSWYNNKINPFKDIIEVKTVSLAKKRECGFEWIYDKKANYYLASTFFKNNKVVFKFDDVKYKSGIAIIVRTKNKTLKRKIDNAIKKADWTKYSSRATNGCYHIGKSHIFCLVKDTIFCSN